MTATTARKYNPGFLSDDDLVASFCVRTHEFKSMIEMLRDCTGNSNQHQIVIGPRGSGKTSLLLRVAAEVRRDADLAAGFFPIVFAEESYEVGTAGEFWLECLARLAIQAPKRQDAPDLHGTLADLRAIQDDQILGERCLAALLDFADREGKRLVLMVENLNMMFRDMTDGNAGWRLRKVLQTEPRIVLLASATSRFDEIDQRDHALYDLFRVLTLRPLNTDECALLWETVSGQRRPTKTIRSLEILTGGSPRLLAIVARFGAGLSFRELMDNLFDLVDDHTEYFKSHLESLPAQERRVYLALADLWKPALTKEIAERARLETSKCSAHLARLIERGVVRPDGGSARRKQYYLSERMYNIYYLLRRGKGRLVDVLIRFMEAYYSPDELKETGSATPELQEQVARALVVKSAALSQSDEVLHRFGDSTAPELLEQVAGALVVKSAVLGNLNRPDEALAAYDEVLRRFGASDTASGLQLVALVRKNSILAALGRPTQPQDIAALLAILPTVELPKGAIRVLMAFVIEHGPERMREWIQASAAAELLKPLTTALEREMGLDPRVPEEVSEVAEDIRRELAKMRKARQASDALGGLQRHAVGRGLNQLTMDEVDQDVQAFRKGRKGG